MTDNVNENTENTETTEDKKNFTQNLTDAVQKLQEAKDDLVKRFEEAKEAAPEDTSDLQVALNQVAQLLGEGTAKAKAAYEEAGGIQGISESAVKNAAELGAKAKVFQENVSNSDAYKQAVTSAKAGAAKLQETGFFKNLQEQALKLKQIAQDTYTETYDGLKKGK